MLRRFDFTVDRWGRYALTVVLAILLAGDIYGLVHIHHQTRGDASTPASAVRRAIFDLDHYDLPHYCADFVVAERPDIPELFGAESCSSSLLSAVRELCRVCRKFDQSGAMAVTAQDPTHAIVIYQASDDRYAVRQVEKRVRVVRVGADWLLADDPEASQPSPP